MKYICSNKCLIYLLSCKTRHGKQCIGNTKLLNTNDHFRNRWNNCKTDVGKIESGNMENVKQKFFQILFLQGHL